MSRRGMVLLFTLLVLVILVQVIILDWGVEATFFVTWFLLALIVRHDTRISPAIGLVLLAICPFLLIAQKQTVAEQVANHAFFFLAIGVLVQLEDLILERRGWLEYKLDLSPLWRRTARVREWGWPLRAALALAILVLAAAATFWLYGRITSYRLARMETAYDFVQYLAEATRPAGQGEGEIVEEQAWTIDDTSRQVLYQHPAFSGSSRLAYAVDIERGSRLAFDLATSPQSWQQAGDGVTFSVYIESDQGTQQIFSTYLDPKSDESARRWHPHLLDLGDYAGQTVTLIFETGTGPAGDYFYDWAGWGAPRLLKP